MTDKQTDQGLFTISLNVNRGPYMRCDYPYCKNTRNFACKFCQRHRLMYRYEKVRRSFRNEKHYDDSWFTDTD